MKKDNWKNKLYYGDNLEVIRKYIKDDSIDLCYIDPPFNSKRNYNQIYLNQGKEDIAQAQAFIDIWNWGERAENEYEQIMVNEKGLFSYQIMELITGLKNVLGKSSLLAYLVSMALRIIEIHRVLKPTGSFYLHCDPTSSHYLKLICDSIFCSKGGEYQNEIIWHYRRWTGKAQRFQELHDVIFFYTKSNDYTFNVQYTEYTEGSLHRKKNYHTRIKGDEVYVTSIDDRGVRDNDVWQIQLLNSQAKERLGYPTQKPETLLEKIILASSNKGDIVLDAYCGCGTTIAVAQRLKRKWIGIDITFQSISLIELRLVKTLGKNITQDIELNGVPKDFESAEALAHKEDDRTRKEFEKWAVLTFSNNKGIINEKKGTDGGIDGIAFIKDYKAKNDNDIIYNKVYFSVKSDKKPKLSYIRDFYGVIQRDNIAFGYFITLYNPTNEMINECKKLGYYQCNIIDKKYPKIEIITIGDILNGNRINIPVSHQVEVVKTAKKVKDYTEQYKLEI